MASGLPLQLYRCNYREADVDWRYSGYDGPVATRRAPAATNPLSAAERTAVTEGSGTLLQILKNQLEEAKIQTRHIQAFFDEAMRINHPQGLPVESRPPQAHTVGAGDVMTCKKYVKLMARTRAESVEEINRKWMAGRGEKRRLRNVAAGAEVASDGE
jgi:tRNA pseudouridine38/39 synthase